ncbi:MAG: EFR1 family ferrodoxin [Spirochaetes bacterium]|nr:EFR1 family ferrodoxin [Spirochaetota bacterium]
MGNAMSSAAVIWYSQTGNTGRYGRYIARLLHEKGLRVMASDYRDSTVESVAGADLVIAGTPVYYYEVPVNFRRWIEGLPALGGVPVASFVTFGGEGGNQHNTACTLLNLLSSRGGMPVGMATFGSMSTFAPTWSTGGSARILKYSHIPDGSSYARVREFVNSVLEDAASGTRAAIKKRPDFRELIKGRVSIGSTKLCIGSHFIDRNACTDCGLCERRCPSGSICMNTHSINRKTCIACMACVNNCPSGAVTMSFLGKEIYGYREFLRRNEIHPEEPK